MAKREIMELTKAQQTTAGMLKSAGQSDKEIAEILVATGAKGMTAADVKAAFTYTPADWETGAQALWVGAKDAPRLSATEIAEKLNANPEYVAEYRAGQITAAKKASATFSYSAIRYARERWATAGMAWPDQKGIITNSTSSTGVSWVTKAKATPDADAIAAAAEHAVELLIVPEHGKTAGETNSVTMALITAAAKAGLDDLVAIKRVASDMTSGTEAGKPNNYGDSLSDGWTANRRNPFNPKPSSK